ncbi:MAG: hypothetical protein ACD_16C00053G0008 [uncultured bacterium]|nr:MAG: hypothetical protein ACD_16C00053G0008 [uncultured bacterium]OFW67898.1 MAG: hypothetical protein A2X70_06165 [Alphaproteobacteria bacterium GWC2_42_16]OFW73733.1 MAG: hypothetical protein A2Z80_01235 [Alphaproteobacteria bacterium GWA2_41_27]OFW82143.1 MAG: hypothetical protein A3E50_04875 [Alphaproteobacteria bacterium RIFCSPHIGHO2_12_FULL_42_100]OFW85200.1 MAG: hypothetical protein A2W06_02405 [Alphaproteobacteria bacterium RBG_16_42_14]OFW90840.1 MAG: hypothetical protein A2W46_069
MQQNFMSFLKKSVSLSLLINLFHYYAFAIYAFSAVILAPNFFHAKSLEWTHTLGVLSLSLALLIRPLGGIVFGHIGDRYGRKKALILSLLVVTLSTSAIGLIPTYESFGVTSSFLLILCLFFQGLCMSGQYAGAIIFIQEHTQRRYASFACGIMGAIGVLGALLGTMSSNLFYHALPLERVWRMPFLFVVFLGMPLLYFVTFMKETPEFLATQERSPLNKIPLLHIVKNYKRLLFSTICLSNVPVSLFYLSTVYVPNFLGNNPKINSTASLDFSSFAQGVCILFIPVFGFLADKFGKEKQLKLTNVIIMLAPFLFLSYKDVYNNVYDSYFYALILAMLSALYMGASTAYLSEKFPHIGRYTGLGLGIAIGEGCGAFAPLFCILIKDYYSTVISPAYFLIFLGLISSLGIFLSTKSNSATLEPKGKEDEVFEV